MVEIDHGNGLVTRYGHNSENLVDVGDAVQKGEVIALVGSTGRSTAPHVHLEVFENGRPANPRQFLR
jgi:murein DD-endopeptidase MepM/ murein hydrolase activator NlpD